MMIVNDKVPNNKENFLLKRGNKWFVIIQQDKVIQTHRPATFELDNTLVNIIDNSLKYFPRKYILSSLRDPNKPIEKQGFESLLSG